MSLEPVETFRCTRTRRAVHFGHVKHGEGSSHKCGSMGRALECLCWWTLYLEIQNSIWCRPMSKHMNPKILELPIQGFEKKKMNSNSIHMLDQLYSFLYPKQYILSIKCKYFCLRTIKDTNNAFLEIDPENVRFRPP